ncbi:hypothetical protein [Streptomyces sp. Tu 3180]|uniref:hypothetical protein n=1 Tax=Streptomyces sp. Tu 3180 TaxID=2682611 RepID=UPI001FB85260|nr:hypothetical protein [Streptomyces sp. Tu 3180]
MAVSALSGCVTVERPAVPGPPAAPPRPSEARPVVQAPAREALEMVGPSRPTKTPGTPSHRAVLPTTAPERKAPPGDRNERARPARPRPRPSGPPQRPRALPEIPEPARPAEGGGADPCALGRKYGGWRPGSPESTICEKAYGG